MSLDFDLLSDDEDVLQAALVAAVEAGTPGERRLLDALRFADEEHHAAGIVSALGAVDGPDGVAVLRGRDPFMRGYALMGLASVGDDRAWSEVVEWLRRALDSTEPDPEHDFDDRALVAQSDIVGAVSYLARHAADSGERQRPVVRLLRSRWDRLRGAEQRWLTVTWAACDPSHPASCTELDPAWFTDWISAPLFEALYLPGAQ